MKLSMEIPTLRTAFSHGLSVENFYADLFHFIDSSDPAIWISRISREQLALYLTKLHKMPREDAPLWGIPFAIKDNIDLAGLPTTAACPEFSYMPENSATVVQRLIDAGAIPVGTTNLDQFATGLVGVRSPYGVPQNAIDAMLVPGGSSSGSAVAVARRLVSFSLGTDTAGSGRVPSALNGIVGLKPSKGLLSCKGVVPACRSLDCVSIFAGNVADVETVFSVAKGHDSKDPFSRKSPTVTLSKCSFVFGVPRPEQLKFFGNREFEALYFSAVARMEGLGGVKREIDFSPFEAAARLLYEGPWLAERYLVVGKLIETHPDAVLPVTRSIIEKGATFLATDAFSASYKLAELRMEVDSIWETMDFILLPTAGLAPTLKEVADDPIGINSKLGTYTNFVNLLDLCGCAIPADIDGPVLPFGITLLAPAFHDEAVLDYAARYLDEKKHQNKTSASETNPDEILLAVCGAHMRGLPLNAQLTNLGGRFVREAKTAPVYKMITLPKTGTLPPRPGLVRVGESDVTHASGHAFAVELWALPRANLGEFMQNVVKPLAIGSVELDNNETVLGFVCEAYAAKGAEDISSYGGWRVWLKERGDNIVVR